MKVVLGLLIWILSFLLLFIPFGILFLVKILVVFCLTCRKRTVQIPGETGDSITVEEEWFTLDPNESFLPRDSSWVKGAIHVGLVLKFKEGEKPISVEELKEQFTKSFLEKDQQGGEYDKLYSYLERKGGYVFRVKRNCIDLKDHIFQETLKKGQGLEEFISGWLLQGYKERKPCWEMINIVNEEDASDFVVAFKIHHGLADLYSVLHILDKLTGNSSPYLVRDFKEGTMHSWRQFIEAPTNFGGLKLPSTETTPCRVTVNRGKVNEWMLAFTTFPLEKFKEIRRKHGVRIASIIITIFIRAFKQFVEKDLGKEVPDEIAIGTTLGWPRHPSRYDSTLNRDKICNHWATMLGKAPFKEVESDPLKVLTHVDNAISTFEHLGLQKFMKQIMLPLLWTVPNSLTDMMPQMEMGLLAGITSTVGGDDYALLGRPVENIYSVANFHDNNSCMPGQFCSFSHSGKVDISFGMHPSICRDQTTLDRFAKEYCHNELEALLQL